MQTFVYFATDKGGGAKYCDQRVCVSVCLSVCPLVYSPRGPNYNSKFHQIFCMLHMAMARSSLTANILVDDVMFSYNGANRPESKMTCTFRSVRQVAAPGTNFTISDCQLHFVIICCLCYIV